MKFASPLALAFALLAAPLSQGASFPSITVYTNASIRGTNFVNETFVTNGITLGGVRNTSWPAGGLSSLLSVTPANPQVTTFSLTNGLTQWLVATGNVTITSASLAAAAGFTLHIDNPQATNINVITPIGWHPVSGAGVASVTIGTNILAAGKIGILSAFSRAANDTNVVSLWASE